MSFHRSRILTPVLIIAYLLSGCIRPAPDPGPGLLFTRIPMDQHVAPSNTRSPVTPSFHIQSTRVPGSPIYTPTPDSSKPQGIVNIDPESYIVQRGDTLGGIAQAFAVPLEALMVVNGLSDPNAISEGQVLTIPQLTPGAIGSSFKIIPDSELVYGPMSILLDVNQFVTAQGGYLASYEQIVDGEVMTGSKIVLRVAENYSVNPRLLLAILEHRSSWVTDPDPAPESLIVPIGVQDGWHDGLYRQLTWTANALNRGYYSWKANAVTTWNLSDGVVVPAEPGINAGTAGVQAFFAGLEDVSTWQGDVSEGGLYLTYYSLFGYPFDLAIEPIVPDSLQQPALQLPFDVNVPWAFTSGPHGGWDTGSAWAALDFSPSGTEGCVQRDEWVVAARKV